MQNADTHIVSKPTVQTVLADRRQVREGRMSERRFSHQLLFSFNLIDHETQLISLNSTTVSSGADLRALAPCHTLRLDRAIGAVCQKIRIDDELKSVDIAIGARPITRIILCCFHA